METGLTSLKGAVASAIADALRRLDREISTSDDPQWVGALEATRVELVAMREAMDPRRFSPGFARFLTDSYHGELVDRLVEVAYRYRRLGRKISKPPSVAAARRGLAAEARPKERDGIRDSSGRSPPGRAKR